MCEDVGMLYLAFALAIVVSSFFFFYYIAFIRVSSHRRASESMHQLTIFILSAVIVQLSHACYITNCPIGGKRSLSLKNNHHPHECPRCGMNGQCYGPAICCTSLGCRIGHPLDSRQCSTENRSVVPCTLKSAACSAVPNGRCAANGVCCGTESCQMDESCSFSTNQDDELPILSV